LPPGEKPQKILHFFRLYITSICPASIGTKVEPAVKLQQLSCIIAYLSLIPAPLPGGPEKIRRARPKEGKRNGKKPRIAAVAGGGLH
jgi:hypothetical protein